MAEGNAIVNGDANGFIREALSDILHLFGEEYCPKCEQTENVFDRLKNTEDDKWRRIARACEDSGGCPEKIYHSFFFEIEFANFQFIVMQEERLVTKQAWAEMPDGPPWPLVAARRDAASKAVAERIWKPVMGDRARVWEPVDPGSPEPPQMTPEESAAARAQMYKVMDEERDRQEEEFARLELF